MLQDVTGVTLALLLLALVGAEGRPPWLAVLSVAAFSVVAFLAAEALPRVLRVLRDQPDLFVVIAVASGLLLAGIGSAIFPPRRAGKWAAGAERRTLIAR